MNFDNIEKQSHKDHKALEDLGFSYGTATELERLLRVERDTKFSVTQSSNSGISEALLDYPRKDDVVVTFTLRHAEKIKEYWAKLNFESQRLLAPQ